MRGKCRRARPPPYGSHLGAADGGVELPKTLLKQKIVHIRRQITHEDRESSQIIEGLHLRCHRGPLGTQFDR